MSAFPRERSDRGIQCAVRVAGQATTNAHRIPTALFQPTGIALGSDGGICVFNRGTSVGGGEVLRVVP